MLQSEVEQKDRLISELKAQIELLAGGSGSNLQQRQPSPILIRQQSSTNGGIRILTGSVESDEEEEDGPLRYFAVSQQ